MKQHGYSGGQLKDVGFTVVELKDAGFTTGQLYDAGYTPTEIKAGGYTAKELLLTREPTVAERGENAIFNLDPNLGDSTFYQTYIVYNSPFHNKYIA